MDNGGSKYDCELGCATHSDPECLCDVRREEPITLCSDEAWLKNPAAFVAADHYNPEHPAEYLATLLTAGDYYRTIKIDLQLAYEHFHHGKWRNKANVVRRLLNSGIELEHLPRVLGTTEARVARLYCLQFKNKLTFEQLLDMKKQIRLGVETKQIADSLGISTNTVLEMAHKDKQRFRKLMSKETKQQIIAEINQCQCQTRTCKCKVQIARRFGVNPTAVYRLARR